MVTMTGVAIPAFVYRAYDQSDELIYVGSTNNVATRVGQHQAGTPWWRANVARIEVDIHPDLPTARSVERGLIKKLSPPFNVTHSAINRPVRARQRQAEASDRIVGPNTYAVAVTREDGWWMICVPELGLLTQARTWNAVEEMARGVIAAHLDVDPDIITAGLVLTPDDETQRQLALARTKATEADRLRAEALAANQQAARRLHGDGWSYRLIARRMHLTHQRVEQLVKGTR